MWPFAEAKCSAVSLFCSFQPPPPLQQSVLTAVKTLPLTALSRSALMAAACPFTAAIWRGVSRFCSHHETYTKRGGGYFIPAL